MAKLYIKDKIIFNYINNINQRHETEKENHTAAFQKCIQSVKRGIKNVYNLVSA